MALVTALRQAAAGSAARLHAPTQRPATAHLALPGQRQQVAQHACLQSVQRLPAQLLAHRPEQRCVSQRAACLPVQARGHNSAQKTVIITGASSGLGLATAKKLAQSGEWQVIMACRDFAKAELAAKKAGLSPANFTIMHLDLASLESTKQFAAAFKRTGCKLDVLVCNAAVYLPTAKEPTFTADGFELSVATNHLGHFLLVNLLLDNLKQTSTAKCIIVGSITGNTNTVAGNVPPKADLGDLSGLTMGNNGQTASMIDAKEFDGAKAYKDSKVCNMLTMRELHRRYHQATGITFASLYPGCIAETGLFRNHVKVFKTLFPPFQKYITKGYVSEDEAGERLAQLVSDPRYTKSGVYWSWSRETGIFENEVSEEVSDAIKGQKLWDLSEKLVNLKVAEKALQTA